MNEKIDWTKTRAHLVNARQRYFDIGSSGMPALMAVINPLSLRYENGERTKELHDAIMKIT